MLVFVLALSKVASDTCEYSELETVFPFDYLEKGVETKKLKILVF